MTTTINKIPNQTNLFNPTDGLGFMLNQLKNNTLPKKAKIIQKEKTPKQQQAYIEKQYNTQLTNLCAHQQHSDTKKLQGSIENFIGYTQIPTGMAGPILINGMQAKGEFHVPLATTEGALVASYHRGAKATRLCGGINVACVKEGVQRSPLFGFSSLQEALAFKKWLEKVQYNFALIAAGFTKHGKLNKTTTNVQGNQVILTFQFSTGDAAGQNMVTICSDAICKYIINNSPVKPQLWYIESNYAGDKKATTQSLNNVRGKKVIAECVIKDEILKSVLKTSASSVAQYWRASTMAVIQSGSIGAQGHFANGLAALFLATGQDVACVSEAAIGITRMEVVNQNDLYISITAPNLIVGTVGGGTKFATQNECLNILDCAGTGKAKKFAEICGALLLCGELSIAAAIAEGHFTSAHQNLGR